MIIFVQWDKNWQTNEFVHRGHEPIFSEESVTHIQVVDINSALTVVCVPFVSRLPPDRLEFPVNLHYFGLILVNQRCASWQKNEDECNWVITCHTYWWYKFLYSKTWWSNCTKLGLKVGSIQYTTFICEDRMQTFVNLQLSFEYGYRS